MSTLTVQSMGFTWPRDKRGPVLKDISFSLEAGARLAITGVSGVGKSTLCRIVAGLEHPGSGSVILDGHPVNGPSSAATMVFQHYPCFDWLTVRGNIAFGMGPGRNGEVQALIERVGLRDATDLYPAQLSGGMRQRVAIVRALAVRPRVLLLDEPFTALDPITKRQLRDLLLETQQDLGFALIVALHSLDDVYALATHVLCLAGRPAIVADQFAPSTMPFNDLRTRIERAIDTSGKSS